MARVLVTGAGFLGAAIAERFLARGDEVRVLALQLPEDMGEWASGLDELVLADITNPDAVAHACGGCDIVVHTAALNAAASAADDRAAVLVNGYGTANVVAAAVEAGVRSLVFLSTFHVYGVPRTPSIDERTPCFPVSSYAATHLLGESFLHRAAAERQVACSVLRLANGYGAPMFASADCWTLAANDFARSAVRAGEIVLGTHGTQRRDFIAVADVARAVERFADSPAAADPPVVCVGSGRPAVSIRELAGEVAAAWHRLSGIDVPVRVTAAGEAPPSAEFAYDVSLARALGFAARDSMDVTLEGLLRFVEGHPEL